MHENPSEIAMTSFRQFVFFFMVSMATANFPAFVKVCKNDANISACVKENMLLARSHLPTGIPRLYLLPTDPFLVTSVQVASPSLTIEMNNLEVSGLHDFDVVSMHVDLAKNSFETELNFPRLGGHGDYKLSGKILLLHLNGAGKSSANMTDMNVKLRMSGVRAVRDGKSYIDFTQREVKLKINGDTQVYFDHLFPTEELTRSTNKVLNENIRDVLDELRPVLEESIVGIIWQSIKTLFDKVPVEELFP